MVTRGVMLVVLDAGPGAKKTQIATELLLEDTGLTRNTGCPQKHMTLFWPGRTVCVQFAEAPRHPDMDISA